MGEAEDAENGGRDMKDEVVDVEGRRKRR